jgi:hypothetical protein
MISTRTIVTLFVLAVFACTEKQPKQPVLGSSPSAPAAAAAAKAVQRTSGSVPVKILPDVPTVLNDLQVVFTCSQNVAFEWRKNNAVITGQSTDWLLKRQFVKGDEITAVVKCDATEGAATVTIVNSPPSVESVPFSPQDIHAGVDIAVSPIGYDPDGDAVGFHYKWSVNGTEQVNDSPVLKGDHLKRGDTVALTVIPYDRDGEGVPFISQNIVIPNGAPRILSTPPHDTPGDTYTYRVVADDPDGDPISFSLISAPEGMTIDSHIGVISWPITEKSAGEHIIEIAVQDSMGARTTQKYTITITATEGNKQ